MELAFETKQARSNQSGPVRTYLHEGAGLTQKVVNSIAWDPDHRGIGHAKSHPLRPLRVVVIMAIGDGGVGDAVKDKDSKHDHRSKELPAEIPEDVWLVSRHLLNTVAEPVTTELR